MQPSQRYVLTIYDLFTIAGGGICGAEAEVAILDDCVEIDRMKFSGKCQSKEGYSRAYSGKAGLTAQLLSGSEGMSFAWGKAEVDPYQPVIAWRRRLSSPPRQGSGRTGCSGWACRVLAQRPVQSFRGR